MDLVVVGASWLHLVATVALLGYYAILGLVVLPVLRRTVPDDVLGDSVAALYRRGLPVIVGSFLVFLATGVYLMGTDPKFGTLGSFSGGMAPTLFLVKHVIVLGMVGLAVYVDGLVVKRIAATGAVDRPAAVRRFALIAQVMALLGAVVLLLTAAAQAS